MDKKCKICWSLLILFLVLNTVFIGIWIEKTNVGKSRLVKDSKVERSSSKSQSRYKNYLIKELKMDSLQAIEYVALKRKHVNEMQETMKGIDTLRILLGDEVFSEVQDSVRIAELIEDITAQKMIFEWKNINHLKDVKSILSEEQRNTFDKLHKKMMSKMKHGGGSPFRGEGRGRNSKQ